MPRFEYESTIKAPADLVFGWHQDPAAIEKLIPPWEPVTLVGTPAHINENGSRTTLKISLFGFIPVYWVAEHRNFQAGHSFQDVQIKGPFASWRHTHIVEPADGHNCRYLDQVEYALPLGWLGELTAGWLVRQKLKKMFAYRHHVVTEECERLSAAGTNGGS